MYYFVSEMKCDIASIN